ncbi:MAG: hypothetical protein JW883_10765 [Deltaproteobacteria bacterium]|nr:hypothetical protein [Deltaproteobacteria bacterium]
MTKSDEKTQGHRFSKDFLTGCLAIILILAIVFVLVPLLILALKVSIFIAIPVGLVLALVVLTAFFGRIINLLRRKW